MLKDNQLKNVYCIYMSYCHSSLFQQRPNTFSHSAGALQRLEGNVLSDAVAGVEGSARGPRTSGERVRKHGRTMFVFADWTTCILTLPSSCCPPASPPPFLSPLWIITRQIAGVNVTGRTDGES